MIETVVSHFRLRESGQFVLSVPWQLVKMFIVSPSQSQTWQDNGIFRTSSSFGDTNHTSKWVCSRVLVLPCRVLDVLIISAIPGTSRTENFYHHSRSCFEIFEMTGDIDSQFWFIFRSLLRSGISDDGHNSHFNENQHNCASPFGCEYRILWNEMSPSMWMLSIPRFFDFELQLNSDQ
jgi:hypothetical protein